MTSNLRPPAADLARLLAGEHHDPHSILGAHEYGKRTVIRALRPHATGVTALIGNQPKLTKRLAAQWFVCKQLARSLRSHRKILLGALLLGELQKCHRIRWSPGYSGHGVLDGQLLGLHLPDQPPRRE